MAWLLQLLKECDQSKLCVRKKCVCVCVWLVHMTLRLEAFLGMLYACTWTCISMRIYVVVLYFMCIYACMFKKKTWNSALNLLWEILLMTFAALHALSSNQMLPANVIKLGTHLCSVCRLSSVFLIKVRCNLHSVLRQNCPVVYMTTAIW